jgi:hypothetical protein
VRHGGLLGPLWGAAIWGTARPAAELRVTERLRAAGAPVPRPLLVVAQRVRGPLWSAVVGTQHVEDARDGVAWLAARPDRSALLRGARAAGAAIRRFHDAGGSHADLHVKNLLFRERGADTEVLVIDLDRARADAPPDPRRCAELMRPRRAARRASRAGYARLLRRLSAHCGRPRAAPGAARGTPRERRGRAPRVVVSPGGNRLAQPPEPARRVAASTRRPNAAPPAPCSRDESTAPPW